MKSLEEAQLDVESHADALALAGRILEWVFIAAGIAGLVRGAILAVHKRILDTGLYHKVDHPDLGIGIEVMVGSVLVALMSWAIFRGLRVFGEYVTVRLRSDDELANG